MRRCKSLRRLKEREIREKERCEGKCECGRKCLKFEQISCCSIPSDNYTFGIEMLS